MKPDQLDLLLARATDHATRRKLARLEPLVSALQRYEGSFIERVNVSKATRGEAPTRLSRSEQQRIAGLAQDAAEIDAEVTQMLQQMDDIDEMLEIFRLPLADDIAFHEQSLRHYHPDERPIGEEGLALKRSLLDAIDAVLSDLADRR